MLPPFESKFNYLLYGPHFSLLLFKVVETNGLGLEADKVISKSNMWRYLHRQIKGY